MFRKWSLNDVVFVVDWQNRRVIESRIRDLDYMSDVVLTTSPRGVEPIIHRRGREIWTWGLDGQFPRMLDEFDTEDEAQSRLDQEYAEQFMCRQDSAPFAHRDQAEWCLADLIAAELSTL